LSNRFEVIFTTRAANFLAPDSKEAMSSDIRLANNLSKRKREQTQASTFLPIAPPPGSLLQLELTISDSTIEDGRIHVDQTFTKKLVTECLGLPSRIKTALRYDFLFEMGFLLLLARWP
jgi:hypothetical protein